MQGLREGTVFQVGSIPGGALQVGESGGTQCRSESVKQYVDVSSAEKMSIYNAAVSSSAHRIATPALPFWLWRMTARATGMNGQSPQEVLRPLLVSP